MEILLVPTFIEYATTSNTLIQFNSKFEPDSRKNNETCIMHVHTCLQIRRITYIAVFAWANIRNNQLSNLLP